MKKAAARLLLLILLAFLLPIPVFAQLPLEAPDGINVGFPLAASFIPNANDELVIESSKPIGLLAAGFDFTFSDTVDSFRILHDPGTGPTLLVAMDSTAFNLHNIDLTITSGTLTIDGDEVLTDGAAVNFGSNAVASGSYSFAFGEDVTASGDFSYAAGAGSTAATGHSSFAHGYAATAAANHAVALGLSATASGDMSFAAGHGSVASGSRSFSGGYNTTASGWVSTALGFGTQAKQSVSFAHGHYSIADGVYCAAFGDRTVATGYGQFVCGVINEQVPEAVLIVGNGALNNPSNALVVDYFGNSFFGGAIDVETDLTVSGEADIAKVPAKGGISMGAFTAQ